ncbi:MAG: hypothetical protein KAR35_04290 [Candidatus Heimdallarchaeota archaeon]|nr:hypothetical protein [Candidatus Heimdallarchaeota archaeon]MCK5048574.1 hypothetical protein [Candidatus Heimdallarchaeota archaeon]
MRIVIIGSCSARKRLENTKQLTCQELTASKIKTILQNYEGEKTPASNLYLGQQNLKLIEGITELRQSDLFEVEYYLISAGFGLISEEARLPSYECSFKEMNQTEIKRRAIQLKIHETFRKIIKGADFLYLALGKDYLTSLGQWDQLILPPTIAFQETTNGSVISLDANIQSVKSFSKEGFSINGTVGFKGNLFLLFAKKILIANDPLKELKEVISSNKKLKRAFSLNELSKLKQEK